MKSQLEYGSWHAEDWYRQLSKVLRAQCEGLLTAEAWLWQRQGGPLTIRLSEDDTVPGAEPVPNPEFDLLALLRDKLDVDRDFGAVKHVEAMAMQFRAMARLCDDTARQMRVALGEPEHVDYAKDKQPAPESP